MHQSIDTSVLRDFMNYLLRKREEKIKLFKKLSKRIPSNGMVSFYLGSIKHLFNEAKKQYNGYERDTIFIPHTPFENFKIPKQEITRKRGIFAEDILKIYTMSDLNNAAVAGLACGWLQEKGLD